MFKYKPTAFIATILSATITNAAHSQQSSIGDWNISFNIDPINDKISGRARITSSQGYLEFQCTHGGGNDGMMLIFNPNVYSPSSLGQNIERITYRAGYNEPVSEIWLRGSTLYTTGNDAYIDNLVVNMVNSERFTIRAGSTVTATFNNVTNGSVEILRRLYEACDDTVPF